jgi:hypothetical protein
MYVVVFVGEWINEAPAWVCPLYKSRPCMSISLCCVEVAKVLVEVGLC